MSENVESVEKRLDQMKERMNKLETEQVRSEQEREIMLQQRRSILYKVTAAFQEHWASDLQEQVTTIVHDQVTTIVQQQPAIIQVSASPSPSYADVARLLPGRHRSNLRPVSMNTTLSKFNDTMYCPIDTSNVEGREKEKAALGKYQAGDRKEM